MGIVGGNERIQCIEINQNSNKPILIICVYMPTSGGSDKTNEYHETVDLLNEKKIIGDGFNDGIPAYNINILNGNWYGYGESTCSAWLSYEGCIEEEKVKR